MSENIPFDEWSETQEDEALLAIAESSAPKFQIIESNLHVQFRDGSKVKIPLEVKFSIFRKILESEKSDQEQFLLLLEALNREDVAEVLDEQDASAVMAVAERYFNAYSKLANMSVGKSRRSQA